MDGKSKTRTSRNGFSLSANTTVYGHFLRHMISNSKRTGEAKLVCSGCKREFKVPKSTATYRCYECQGVSNATSGYKNSREESGANLFKHDQLDNTDINRGLLSWSSLSIGSSSSLSIACNKRAVLCGVTYGKRRFRLKGTINDVVNMKDLLVNKFAFPIECIRVLTEEEKDSNFRPTKRNILESLKWLVKDCKSGDSLVFYFSGHGLQQTEDHNEDEIDGLDETICPVDFMKEGMITDNEINSIIVRPLKNCVTLHAIIDACHSATTLDLIHVYKKVNGSWKWVDNKPPSKEPMNKNTNGGLVICLSACEDAQEATDTAGFGGKENGVMTYLLTKSIREHPGITYGSLLEKIHEEIEKIHQSKYHNGFFKRIFRRKVEQDPLLSSSEEFDVSRRVFKL